MTQGKRRMPMELTLLSVVMAGGAKTVADYFTCCALQNPSLRKTTGEILKSKFRLYLPRSHADKKGAFVIGFFLKQLTFKPLLADTCKMLKNNIEKIWCKF